MFDPGQKVDLDSLEPEIAASILDECEHPPPVYHWELQEMRVLLFRGLRDPESIPSLFPALGSISFIGCDIKELKFLKSMPCLWSVAFEHSTTGSIEVLKDLVQIKHVTIKSCPVRDLSPLLTLPQLKLVEVEGCPFSDESYHEILPRLAREITADRFPDYEGKKYTRSPLVYSFPDDARQMTKELVSRGLNVTVVTNASGQHYLSAFGLDDFEKPNWDGVKPLPIEHLKALLERESDLTVENLYAASRKYLDEKYG